MAYVTVETEVEVNLGDFDDDDLIEELQDRDYIILGENYKNIVLEKIYNKMKSGQDYTRDLEDYIYQLIGRF